MCYQTTYHHPRSIWSCTSSISVTLNLRGNKTMYKGEINTIQMYTSSFLQCVQSFSCSVFFCLTFSRLKQVLNELLRQQQQQPQQPPPSSLKTGWQTRKQASSQESNSRPGVSPGLFLPFTSTIQPSANNISAAALSPIPPSMTYTVYSLVQSKF